MATIKFWSEMTKATTVDGEDKVMIGRNATGEAMYADFQYLINQAGMNSSDYIPVDGNTLPDGGEGNKVTFAAPGTYTQSGGDDVVVPENSLGIITWDGDEWSLGSSVNIPEAEGVDYIDPEGEGIPKEKAVARWALNKYSERALPVGYEFIDIDRPDLELAPLTIVDEDMNIIPFGGGSSNSGLFIDYGYDRPDLGLTFIDEEGYIIYSIPLNGGGDVDEEEVKRIANQEIGLSEFLDWYTEFGEQEGYNVDPGPTIEEFYEEWDAIMDNKINNPGYPNYITKTLLGYSSMNNKEINRYDFRPPNPKCKVILVGCTHGWEKNPAFMLRRFFSYFVDNWSASQMMQWARWNVHFIVVPVLSAGAYSHTTIVPNMPTRGTRRVMETPPFPATWTKSGTNVTITFDLSDFPDTNGRLNGSEYFSHDGVEGKTFVSILNSSNETLLPNSGFRIDTVINGQTITCTVPGSGTGSGDCDIVVDADPNRQYGNIIPSWESYTSSSSVNGVIESSHDNKGTRPFSLNESRIMRDLLNEEDDGTMVMLLDFHSGAGKYVTYYNNASAVDLTPMHIVQDIVADFHEEPIVLNATPRNPLSAYAAQIHDISGFTPEWSWHANMTVNNATQEHRWFANMILILTRWYYSNKITNNN